MSRIQPAEQPLKQRQRPRSLTADLVQTLSDYIREGRWAAGDKLPREADLIETFQVSRTVVREAMSKLQAAGMVETRHGVGTFVVGFGDSSPFSVRAEQLATLRDVIHVLELRIAVESESAALAAQRRSSEQVQAMRATLAQFEQGLRDGRDAVGADFQFHLEIARATQNPRYAELMTTLGGAMIPRSRLEGQEIAPTILSEARRSYLQGVAEEHRRILLAIENQDPNAAREAMRAHLSNSRERRMQASLSE